MKDFQIEQDFLAEIERNKGAIFKVCYIYSNNGLDLNDLYQEVVVNLWKGYSKFRGECKTSTWIYRISLNTCISFFRKTKSVPTIVPLTIDMASLFEENSNIDLVNEMYKLINKLDKMERALILLWLEEKSYAEIAEILELKVSNVGVRLNRIKEKLKLMSNL